MMRASRASFHGRERELASLGRLIHEGAAIVSVVGPPGVGKTRLVEEFARREHGRADAWPGGVLRAPQTPVDVPQERALLIADVGHDAMDASALQRLVESRPNAVLVVAARQRCKIPGETLVELQGLDDTAARALFRARCRQSGSPVHADSEVIGSIAELVGNLPAALELGADRLRLASPDAVLARMRERTTGPVAALGAWDGQLGDALAAVLASLDHDAAMLLGALSVFRGGFTMDAAVAVAEGNQATEALASLRDACLVTTSWHAPTEEVRLAIPPAVAEYARKASNPGDGPRRRHARYFIRAARQWTDALDWRGELGPDAARHRVRVDSGNLAAAAASSNCADGALIIGLLDRASVSAAGLFADVGARVSRRAPVPDLALAFYLAQARDARSRGDLQGARAALLRAKGVTHTPDRRARYCLASARFSLSLERYDQALRRAERGLSWASKTSLRRVAADLTLVAAWAHRGTGAARSARHAASHVLVEAESQGDRRIAARALEVLATLSADKHNDDAATNQATRSLHNYVECGDEAGAARVQRWAATAALEAGDLPRARAVLLDARLRTEGPDIDRLEASMHLVASEPDAADTALRRAFSGRSTSDAIGAAGDLVMAGIAAGFRQEWTLAATRFERGMERAMAAENIACAARARLLLACVQERIGARSQAQALTRAAIADLLGVRDPATLALVDVVEGHFARDRDRTPGRLPLPALAASRILERAPAPKPEGDPLVIHREGEWFSRAGAVHSLAGHGPARRIFLRLVRERLEAPGRALRRAEVFAAGWPDEVASPNSARNRVYVTIRLLRTSGLEGVLLTGERGYLLDPSILVGWARATGDAGPHTDGAGRGQ